MHKTRYPERRRTLRVSLRIPLRVQCRFLDGKSIDVKASTSVVGAHGALLVMDMPLIPGECVRLINDRTAEAVDCHVTSLREKGARSFVGITFAARNVDFWHIVFPKSGTRHAFRSPQTGSLEK
jgi:hypothetical protein